MKTKVIHYVRHGESLANEAIRNALAAAGLTDAKNQFAGEAKKVSYEVMQVKSPTLCSFFHPPFTYTYTAKHMLM